MKLILILSTLLTAFVTSAEEKAFSGSTEASAVVINGNSKSETYSAKTENTYAVTEYDLAKVFGKYVKTSTGGVESTKAWEAGLRYERIFTKDQLSGFIQQKAEHDPYNGVFIQRDSTDIGAKYTLIKNDQLTWFAELGYQYTKTYIATELPTETGGFIRGYTEAAYQFSASASAKLWVEHLAPLKSSNFSRTNTEASVTATLTELFSLKMAYLLNHDEAAVSPFKKDTSTLTTSLIAKY